MRVTLIDPNGARIVPILANYGLPTLVQQGETIDVPDEVAGRAPAWRAATDEDHAQGPRHMDHVNKRFTPERALEIEDLGTGLLAQLGVWEVAE